MADAVRTTRADVWELLEVTSQVAGADGRFDRALARMAGRLSLALERIGDDDTAVRFLRSIADADATAAPDRDRSSRFSAADGACLELPVPGADEPIDRLVSRLAPTPLEIDVLLLAALAHHHESVAAILRRLHPHGEPWPTVGLAATMAELGTLGSGATGMPHARSAMRAVLDGGVFVRAGALVVVGDGPHAERSVRLGALVFEALAGLGGWPAPCTPDPRPTPAAGLDAWFADPAVRAAGAVVEAGADAVVAAVTERPDALAGRLAALVVAAGQQPVVLHAAALDQSLVTSVCLLAVLRDLTPVIWSDAAVGERIGAVDVPGPVLLALACDKLDAWPRPVLRVPTAPLARTDRIDATEGALPELGRLTHPIGPATVEPAELAIAAGDVRARARFGRLPIDRGDLIATIDARAQGTVPAGAVLRHPSATWDDLVLPDDRLQQLREAVARMHEQARVFHEWGFLRGRAGRTGLRMLFCGPPGTGKTLAAEVVANELGRDLLVVDLSQMVSKWIGETEKNLAAAFDAAERGGAVLFFDEADALFGKRTEVGDARDRYANLETAYLLARLERFDGVAVLATNLRQNLDAAFARRIEFIVPFDLPDVAARERLWRHHLPSTAPVASSVDCARLAALYELPGALIRNAAVAAAFLAASDTRRVDTGERGSDGGNGGDGGDGGDRGDGGNGGAIGPSISLRHLVHAVRREYVKAGQAFPGAPSGVPV